MRGVKDPKAQKRLETTVVRGGRGPQAEPLAERLEPPADPLVGKTIIYRYKIVELIGQGGMGNVYLAEDTRLGKKVAVKVLPDYFGQMSTVADRFIQEALLAPRIEHENIIDVTDRGKTSEGVPFFVMEYLKGSDLSATIAREGPFPWSERARDIILQMCRGLEAAHEKGIVHRDLKPENVFLVERSDNRMFIKLFDFGIAKLIESARAGEQKEGSLAVSMALMRPGATQAGSVMGTPQYMAPEQAAGGDIDRRVDVYALGTIMYEMLCGKPPFALAEEEKDNPMADTLRILEMQKSQEPVPPRVLRPDLHIPQDVEAVILKALSKDREGRFATMKEMEEALLSLNVPEVIQLRTPAGQASVKDLRPGSRAMMGYAAIARAEETRRKKASRRLALALAAVAAVAGTVAGAKAYERYRHDQAVHVDKPETGEATKPPVKGRGAGYDDDTKDIQHR